MYRQGDVLLVPVSNAPSDAKIVKREGERTVLAYGEATGHHHSFAGGAGVELLVAGDARFLRVTKAAELTHQEHSTIPVAPGDYSVVIQREYDDVEEWRRVQD